MTKYLQQSDAGYTIASESYYGRNYYSQCTHCNSVVLPLTWSFSISGLVEEGTYLVSSPNWTPCQEYNGDWILRYDTSQSWFRSDIDYNCVWTSGDDQPLSTNRCDANNAAAGNVIHYEQTWALHYRAVYRAWVLETTQACNSLRYEFAYITPGNPPPSSVMNCAEVMTMPISDFTWCAASAPAFVDLTPGNFVENVLPGGAST